MKNFILSLYFFAFALSLTGCGGGGEGGGSGNGGGNALPRGVSLSLGWDTPSIKENGDPLSLSEIGGYKIYVSQNTNYIPSVPYVDINDSTMTSYTLNNILPGTYYIYVTTYDLNGDESPYSDPITTTI